MEKRGEFCSHALLTRQVQATARLPWYCILHGLTAPTLTRIVGRDRMSLAIDTFAENVRRFCQWTEAGPHDIETARQLLLALMQGVPYLVVGEDERGDEPEYPRRQHEGWQLDHKRFSD